MFWQRPQPTTILDRSVLECVIVADLCKVVIARIGVSTLAVLKLISNGMIVVPLNAVHIGLLEQWEYAIGIGAEGTQVTEAIDGIDTAALNVA